jgi:hypothetical protein
VTLLSAKSTPQGTRVFISPLQNFHPARRPTAARRTYQHVVLSTRKQTGAHVALSTRKEANQRPRRKHYSTQESTVARAERHCNMQKTLFIAQVTRPYRNHCNSVGHCSFKEKFCHRCTARLFRVLPPLKCVARVSYLSSASPHHPVAKSSCSAAHFFFFQIKFLCSCLCKLRLSISPRSTSRLQ